VRSGAKRFFFLVLLFPVFLSVVGYPCTSLFLPGSPDAVVAADMDWVSGGGLVYINKRDVLKTSAFVYPRQYALQWTSKYMSLALSQTGREFPWEGMNEKGLSVNILLFSNAQLPPSNGLTPEVNGLQFVQYLLDTSATTAEAVANAQNVQIAGLFAPSEHYFVCDLTGDCATIENVASSLVIHEGTSLPYMALANDSYKHALTNFTALLSSDTQPQILHLPASDSLTRFAKAAVWSSEYIPQENDVTYALTALRSLAEGDTRWQMIFSLANQSLQWETPTASALKSVNLNQFDPQCSSGVQVYHVNAQAVGDVTSSFVQYTDKLNNELIQSNIQANGMSAGTVALLQAYPATTQCMEENATLSSSPNPSVLGQPVVLTAQAKGAGSTASAGSVTFMSGATVLGTVMLNSSGVAQLTATNLNAGTDSLSVVYDGDVSDPAINSPPLSQYVYEFGTRTNLVSSLNPAVATQWINFVATVTSPGGGIPTGTVTFSQNGTPIATVPLSAYGQAIYPKSFAGAGTKTISASYSGTSNYQPSVSSPLNQTVD
jgi:penicillin V acylase-like amidase (Ntn superfamily)